MDCSADAPAIKRNAAARAAVEGAGGGKKRKDARRSACVVLGLLDLPDECLLRIAARLNIATRTALAHTCQRLRMIVLEAEGRLRFDAGLGRRVVVPRPIADRHAWKHRALLYALDEHHLISRTLQGYISPGAAVYLACGSRRPVECLRAALLFADALAPGALGDPQAIAAQLPSAHENAEALAVGARRLKDAAKVLEGARESPRRRVVHWGGQVPFDTPLRGLRREEERRMARLLLERHGDDYRLPLAELRRIRARAAWHRPSTCNLPMFGPSHDVLAQLHALELQEAAIVRAEAQGWAPGAALLWARRDLSLRAARLLSTPDITLGATHVPAAEAFGDTLRDLEQSPDFLTCWRPASAFVFEALLNAIRRQREVGFQEGTDVNHLLDTLCALGLSRDHVLASGALALRSAMQWGIGGDAIALFLVRRFNITADQVLCVPVVLGQPGIREVDMSHVVVNAPKTLKHLLRSGTFTTSNMRRLLERRPSAAEAAGYFGNLELIGLICAVAKQLDGERVSGPLLPELRKEMFAGALTDMNPATIRVLLRHGLTGEEVKARLSADYDRGLSSTRRPLVNRMLREVFGFSLPTPRKAPSLL